MIGSKRHKAHTLQCGHHLPLPAGVPQRPRASEKSRFGCLFCCLHRILPTWSLSIPAANVTQIYFQRAGGELVVCSYNSCCPTFRGLSGSSLPIRKPGSRTGSGSEHTLPGRSRAARKGDEPPQGQSSNSLRQAQLVALGSGFPVELFLGHPLPPLCSLLPNVGQPEKKTLPSAL